MCSLTLASDNRFRIRFVLPPTYKTQNVRCVDSSFPSLRASLKLRFVRWRRRDPLQFPQHRAAASLNHGGVHGFLGKANEGIDGPLRIER